MRKLLPVAAVLALAACDAPSVDSRSGVGFQDYSLYQQQQIYLARVRAQEARRAAEMRAAPVTAAPVPVAAAPAPAPVAAAPSASQSIAADTLAALGAPAAAAPAPAAAPAAASAPLSAVVPSSTPAPAPAAAPAVPSGSNIAAFALATSHPVGQQMYRRNNPFRQNAFERACARYASDSLAQEAFLEAGGPERDRLSLDPDGDGYACRWDPSAFRLARQGG